MRKVCIYYNLPLKQPQITQDTEEKEDKIIQKIVEEGQRGGVSITINVTNFDIQSVPAAWHAMPLGMDLWVWPHGLSDGTVHSLTNSHLVQMQIKLTLYSHHNPI